MTPADSGAVAPASSLSTARPEVRAGETTAGWARTAETTMRSVSDMGHDVAAEAGGEPALRTQWRETANEEMR
jgi:hypothetical protein